VRYFLGFYHGIKTERFAAGCGWVKPLLQVSKPGA